MRCEFEEKSYEVLHTIELMGRERVLFPPGQRLESSLGFDVALLSGNARFWQIVRDLGYWYSVSSGVSLRDVYWDRLGRFLDSWLPALFRFNVFIQYKRPEYIMGSNAREYMYWRRPYFRYSLLEHQLELMARLETHDNRGIAVVYAAPAFYRWQDLFGYYFRGVLIENSNYVRPSDLVGHTRWTYVNGGALVTETSSGKEPGQNQHNLASHWIKVGSVLRLHR